MAQSAPALAHRRVPHPHIQRGPRDSAFRAYRPERGNVPAIVPEQLPTAEPITPEMPTLWRLTRVLVSPSVLLSLGGALFFTGGGSLLSKGVAGLISLFTGRPPQDVEWASASEMGGVAATGFLWSGISAGLNAWRPMHEQFAPEPEEIKAMTVWKALKEMGLSGLVTQMNLNRPESTFARRFPRLARVARKIPFMKRLVGAPDGELMAGGLVAGSTAAYYMVIGAALGLPLWSLAFAAFVVPSLVSRTSAYMQSVRIAEQRVARASIEQTAFWGVISAISVVTGRLEVPLLLGYGIQGGMAIGLASATRRGMQKVTASGQPAAQS